MIFLKPNLAQDLDAPGRLLAAVQHAVQIEYATIPVYLYALYSLKQGKNNEIIHALREIANEEMLHMILACNLLNALGGAPVVNSPKVVPTYPGEFPGGLEPRLSLEQYSGDLVGRVFLPIEEPEDPLRYPLMLAKGRITVGMFYGAIRKRIVAGGDRLFVGDPARQVTDGFPEVREVRDTASAVLAIDFIVQQGEGTSKSPVGPDGKLAHYYRFEELHRQIRFVPDPCHPQGGCYCGDPVPFEPDDVFAVPRNPKARDYPRGSSARRACEMFNYTYTSLLNALQEMVNGNPAKFRDAFGLMFSLKHQAAGMMAGATTDGKSIGPSFEHQLFAPE